MTKKAKKTTDDNNFEQKITELTTDLQRTRADFENYRKHVEIEKNQAKEAGQISAILKLIPIIDNIERAIGCVPEDLKDNSWAKGVTALLKNLEKSLSDLNLQKIDAKPGTIFNPDLHNAIQFNEDAEGDQEVVEEELLSGYLLNNSPIRHSMVKVTKKQTTK